MFVFLTFFFLHFFKGNFDNAVEILKPIRYKIVKIGGSNAQVRMWRVMFKSVEKELLIKFKTQSAAQTFRLDALNGLLQSSVKFGLF